MWSKFICIMAKEHREVWQVGSSPNSLPWILPRPVTWTIRTSQVQLYKPRGAQRHSSRKGTQILRGRGTLSGPLPVVSQDTLKPCVQVWILSRWMTSGSYWANWVCEPCYWRDSHYIYGYMYIRIYVYMYICVYVYTYMCICTSRHPSSSARGGNRMSHWCCLCA